jgi:type II secretory pathway component PulF
MSTFSYVAFEDSGRRREGVVNAVDSSTAAAAVAAQGFHVLEVKEKRASVAAGGRKSISRSDVALFTRRLADLARAGIPLDRALQLAGGQSENPALTDVTQQAIVDVRAGLPISEALSKFPKLFPPAFTMTLRAGEASGQFPEVAGRLATFQQIELQRRSKVIAAMVYPCILLVTAVGVVAFMIGFVVPKLATVFDKLGSDLPLSTQILLSVSGFLVQRFGYIAGAVVLIGFFLRAYLATVQGAVAKDRLLLNIPLLGKVITQATVSRYARLLGTLLYGGVPILEALQISGAASGNRLFESATHSVQTQVREGKRIGDSMEAAGVFTPILVQMVTVGEETGDLPEMLNRVSENLDFEVENSMAKLTALIEPLIVLTMGVFVGFVVLSILLPVYQAQDLIK